MIKNISISRLLLPFCYLFYLCNLQAASVEKLTYFEKHDQGWHWYHDHLLTKRKDNKGKEKLKSKNNLDPIRQVKLLRENVRRALDKAILTPSIENIKNYMLLQQSVTQKASRFSQIWREVLLQYPTLDYSIKHPVNHMGRALYQDLHLDAQNEAIKKFFKDRGLFYFYKGDCPYCRKFSPVLKQFVAKYQIHLIPITMGGGELQAFPHSRVDSGQSKRFGVTVWPALFSVNPSTHKVIPVAFGLLSGMELRERILDIVTHFKGG